MKKLIGVAFIWFACAFAWVVLGATVVVRSGSSDGALLEQVHLLWGPPATQAAPTASYSAVKRQRQTEDVEQDGRRVRREVTQDVPVEISVPLEGTSARVSLVLQQRRKGLLWFPTFASELHATYSFENPSEQAQDIQVVFPLSSGNTVYDGFQVSDEKGAPMEIDFGDSTARWKAHFQPHERRRFSVRYRSRGTGSWSYRLTSNTGRVRNFQLTVDTSFPNIDFPAGALSPTAQLTDAHGWHGTWSFENLVTDSSVGITLPQRLNPGELAAKITFFAPVSLLFFFFVVAILSAAQRRAIHPLNYFLFGCAFFAFHLLFAYLVDHLAIVPAFALSSAVSIFLVVSYARLFVGWRFALREMAIAQLIYLVLFSVTFFWTGFTGLAITIGAIVTLFVVMQITGRVAWQEVMRQPAPSSRP